MNRVLPYLSALAAVGLLTLTPACVSAQQSLTWEQVKARFESANPALKAAALSIDEAHAAETTAHLRPNPQLSAAVDGLQIAPSNGTWQPASGLFVIPTLSYLHERGNKRELRTESAREGTEIVSAQHDDLQRNLEFNLRAAFIATLEAKAIVSLAQGDLEYYDHIIQVSRDRFHAGDIAQIDLDRIELQRVQYESELQSALVNLRTAKIQLLQLLNDRTPVDQFDVQGAFDFSETLQPLDDVRHVALDSRPDLRAALEAVQQAQTNHKLAIANGAVDPTFSGWYTWNNAATSNSNADHMLGMSVTVPLRIFDRNQGEKQRTAIDIDRRQQASEATRAQIFSDVDSAYAQIESTITLLKPYKAQYNTQAARVRDTISYSYLHGGASLMDFLNAQSDYRQVQLAYAQLIGAYLTAAGQLNLAVGREVIP